MCSLLGGVHTLELSSIFPVGMAIWTQATSPHFHTSIWLYGMYTGRKANKRLFLGLLKCNPVISFSSNFVEEADKHLADGVYYWLEYNQGRF